MVLKPGSILEKRYQIKEKVGSGGFGNVYRAYDKIFGDDVAVKEFNLYSAAQFSDPEEMRKRFEQEARITRKLEHPHIVSIYNLFYAHDTCYIVMPFLPETLADRLKGQNFLDVPEALRVMEQICAGVGYAHTFQAGEGSTAAVVHCDIKPGNILFDKNNQARVTDFGIAHVSEDIDASYKTVGSFEAGTVEYMAPEQLKGIRDDPRLDVYALGALLYKMLTATNYLSLDSSTTGHAQAQNIMRIITDEPLLEPLKEKNVPQPVIQIILKALGKDPQDRYANAQEMYNAIAAYRGGLVTSSTGPGSSVASTPAGTPLQKKSAAHLMPIAIIGVIVLCLVVGLGGGIFAWLNLDSEPEAATTGVSSEVSLGAQTPAETATPAPTDTPTGIPTGQPTAEPTPTDTPTSTTTAAAPAGPITCPANMALISAPETDFCLDVHEVTNAAYQQCELAGNCEPPVLTRSQSQSDYYGHSDFDNYPIIQVTWFNARTYCEFTGRRLPTGPEWELAAAGPQGNAYPDIPDPKAPDTKPVQSVEQDVTAAGVYDLMGNVREWVDEDADAVTKVIKGKSFSVGDKPSLPDLSHFDVGFRCASDGEVN